MIPFIPFVKGDASAAFGPIIFWTQCWGEDL
jgi:hypothetical protein